MDSRLKEILIHFSSNLLETSHLNSSSVYISSVVAKSCILNVVYAMISVLDVHSVVAIALVLFNTVVSIVFYTFVIAISFIVTSISVCLIIYVASMALLFL